MRCDRLVPLLLSILFLSGCGGKTDDSPQLAQSKLVFGGWERIYYTYLPAGYDERKPYPLILAFHGGGGNALQAHRYFNLSTVADEMGYVVVYPEGVSKTVLGKKFATWNGGRCCGMAMDKDIDDVGFVRELIEELKDSYNIDSSRIYVLGMSNGAQMSFRLACELSDVIAAAAPVGSMGTFKGCKPERSVPIYSIVGTDDPCSPYGGGNECGGCFTDFFQSISIPVPRVTYACDSAQEHITYWVELQACEKEPEIISDGVNATCLRYTGCRDGSEINLCTVSGGGHTWPGNKGYSPDQCRDNPDGLVCVRWADAVGPTTPDFDGNRKIVEFFKRHKL